MKLVNTSLVLLLSASTAFAMEIEHHVPMSEHMSAQELAEKACKLMGLEGCKQLRDSLADLFSEKHPSPEQLQRRTTIIRKISESDEGSPR